MFAKPRSAKRFFSERALLAFGIVVRLITFVFLAPQNSDGHSLVVSFIVNHGRLPHSGELGQAYHPALYYLLAAPIYYWTESFKAVQALSLVFSVLTLWVLYRLIFHSGLIGSKSAQWYGFALVCFLPQFVLFTLFVSNDTLAIFLGCCLAWSTMRFVNEPGPKQLAALMLIEILGLLTKATFVAYLPVMCALVFFVWWKSGQSFARSAARSATLAVALGILAFAASSYKEIDNYQQYGHAFVSNIDFNPAWAVRQRQACWGAISFVDFNFARLISSPSLSPATEGAYPLMLYATFWYQHIPECSFFGSSRVPFTWIAIATYVFGLLPTAVFLCGLLMLLRRSRFVLINFSLADGEACRQLTILTLAALAAANLGIMLAALAKYHVYSIMQGRLLFPSLSGILAIFSVGVERIEKKKLANRVLKASMAGLCVLFLIYLSGEISLQIVQNFMPGLKAYLKAIAG